MPVALNNSKDIVANSVAVIKGNKLIDVLETVDSIQGLAPETLNSLEKLASALNNDSNYFQTVSSAINGKADKTDTYTKQNVDQKFTDIVGGTPEAPVIINTFEKVSDKFKEIDGSTVAEPVLTNTFKKVSDALGGKADKNDTYTKQTVDQKFTDIVGGTPGETPVTLNTFKKVSDKFAYIDGGTYEDPVPIDMNTFKKVSNVISDIEDALDKKAPYFTTTAPLLFELNPQNPNDLKLSASVYTKAETDDRLNLRALKQNAEIKEALTILDVNNVPKILLRTDGSSTINTQLNVDGAVYAQGGVFSDGQLCAKLADTYDKFTIDDKLALKLSSNSAYIKEDSDARYAQKAVTYTKTECDGRFAPIASADTYTKTESDNKFATKANPTFTGELTAESLKTFTFKTTEGTLSPGVVIDGLSVKNSLDEEIMTAYGTTKAVNFLGNVVCNQTLYASTLLVDNFSPSFFFPTKPYVAGYVAVEAIAHQFGHVNATLSRPNGSPGVYQFNFTTAHPRGNNYLVIAQIRTGGTSGQTFSFTSTNVQNSTSFNVWVRNSTMGAIVGDFYFYTVP